MAMYHAEIAYTRSTDRHVFNIQGHSTDCHAELLKSPLYIYEPLSRVLGNGSTLKMHDVTLTISGF